MLFKTYFCTRVFVKTTFGDNHARYGPEMIEVGKPDVHQTCNIVDSKFGYNLIHFII